MYRGKREKEAGDDERASERGDVARVFLLAFPAVRRTSLLVPHGKRREKRPERRKGRVRPREPSDKEREKSSAARGKAREGDAEWKWWRDGTEGLTRGTCVCRAGQDLGNF